MLAGWDVDIGILGESIPRYPLTLLLAFFDSRPYRRCYGAAYQEQSVRISNFVGKRSDNVDRCTSTMSTSPLRGISFGVTVVPSPH